MSAVIADRTILKLEQHPGISSELKQWITDRTYESNCPVSIEGYTAADIVKLAPGWCWRIHIFGFTERTA